ncbi:DUF3192 domain-containing protein [Candidatus Poribacteria bacterium]|nr:DUF3192 domain-containing protein [Candidatus Poribacteria bacterium]
MGTGTIKTENLKSTINNPYKTETLNDKENKTCEVLFFYTKTQKRDGIISDNELTPIILHNEKVVGWGWEFMRQIQ